MGKIKLHIVEEVNALINEASSVSMEVNNVRKNLIDTIEKDVETVLPDAYGKNGVNLLYRKLDYEMWGNKIPVFCTIVHAKDKSCLVNYLNNSNVRENSFEIDLKTRQEKLFLTLFFVGNGLFFHGNPDSISHELEHVYQHFCKKNNVEDYDPFIKDRKNYQKYVDLCNSEDKVEKCVGFVGYLSDYSEQDAMIQGLAGEMDGVSSGEVYVRFEKTATINVLKNYRTALKILKKRYPEEKYKRQIDSLCSEFGVTFNKFVKNGEVGLKRFEYKIGKVLKYYSNSSEKTLFERIIEDLGD